MRQSQNRRLARLLVLTACMAAMAAMGCASLPYAPRYPAGTAPAVRLGLASDGRAEPQLRPGDAVLLQVVEGEKIRPLKLSVDGLGAVHVASGKDVEVAGLSVAGAEKRVANVLREREPLVQVTMRLSEDAQRRAAVLGAVARPGQVKIIPGMRVSDLIFAAGGLLASPGTRAADRTSSADLDHAVLVRDGGALPINIQRAMQGAIGHNVYAMAGDYLYLPFKGDPKISVFGQVWSPRVLDFRKGYRLTEALSAAGGVTKKGDKADIRLVRGGPLAPAVYRASLRAIVDGHASDVVLSAGDVVFVSDDPTEDFSEVIKLLAPLAALAVSVASVILAASL